MTLRSIGIISSSGIGMESHLASALIKRNYGNDLQDNLEYEFRNTHRFRQVVISDII